MRPERTGDPPADAGPAVGPELTVSPAPDAGVEPAGGRTVIGSAITITLAVVLTNNDEHIGKVYELSGDVAWNHHELAATITEIVGRDVVYTPVRPEDYLSILVEYGLDEGMAGFVVALDGETRTGLSSETPRELSALIGRPTTPLAEGLSDPAAAPGFSLELLRVSRQRADT